MPSLKALPHDLWLAMIPFELLISLGLIVPAFNKRLAVLAPIAAACVAAEMLLFCAVHLSSGSAISGPLIYWLVVAAVCACIVYGRLVLRPLNR